MNYAELIPLASAEILLLLTALVALAADLARRGPETRPGGVATGVGLVGCGVTLAWLGVGAPDGVVGGGMLVSDALTRLVKLAVVGLTAGTLVFAGRLGFTPHRGEFVATVLLGAVGMLLMVGTENVLMMFLALELASLSLYILTAFDKRDPRGVEAALKYFLFGGMAGAFLLFGLSLIYGATGSIEFRGISAAAAGVAGSPLWQAGAVMVLVGLGFKVAAAPFHFWAPDAYEAAPAAAAGFIAAGSKVAAFFILLKFCLVAMGTVPGTGGWGAWTSGWVPVLAGLSVISMIWGNVAALAQRNVRRLLAYSAVAHAGYTLVALVAGGSESVAAVMFYASTYALTVLGAFGVVGWVEATCGGSDFEHFAGLSRRSPVMAMALGILVLSLAGIPPLVGFFGKFYVFLVALNGDGGQLGLLWLVVAGVTTTCVSFYYYLQVLKAVFVLDPSPAAGGAEGGTASTWTEQALIVVLAGLVVAAGCLPETVLTRLQSALVAVGL